MQGRVMGLHLCTFFARKTLDFNNLGCALLELASCKASCYVKKLQLQLRKPYTASCFE